MSRGIEIKLVVHPPQTARSGGEPAAKTNSQPPEILPTANGNENGAIFFNLDWQNQQADNRRQRITDSLHGDNQLFTGGEKSHSLPPSLPETARNPESEKFLETERDDLFEPTKDRAKFQEMRRQPETFRREIRQTVEQRKAEIEVKTQTIAQTDSRFGEQLAQMKNAGLSPHEFAQTLPRDEQADFLARFQTSENFNANNIREPLDKTAPQTLANKNQGEKTSADSRSVEVAPTKIVEESTFAAAKTLPAKIPSINPNEAHAKSEFVARDANNFAPKPANGNLVLSESTTTRVFNQRNSENAANNFAPPRESGAAIGGALINGAAVTIEDFPQLENIQIGGSGSGGNFYDSAESIFAAGATGAMMSAAVGSVVPGANGAISGVLGFVSGVVVGIEAEQGLRWLSSNKADAANNLLETKIDDLPNENFSLQLGYA